MESVQQLEPEVFLWTHLLILNGKFTHLRSNTNQHVLSVRVTNLVDALIRRAGNCARSDLLHTGDCSKKN